MPETAEMPKTATQQGQETGKGAAPQLQTSPATAPQQDQGTALAGRGESRLPSRAFRDPFTLMRTLSDEMDRLFESSASAAALGRLSAGSAAPASPRSGRPRWRWSGVATTWSSPPTCRV